MVRLMALRRSASPHEAAALVLDDVRLALDGVHRAVDLRGAFEQACIGAARVAGGRSAVLATGRHGKFSIVASAGEVQASETEVLLRTLSGSSAPVAISGPTSLVVPLPGEAARGALAVFGAQAVTRRALELFGEMAAVLLDLRHLHEQAAKAAHRVQPTENLASTLASIGQGDGLLVVTIDDLDGVRARVGDEAADSVHGGAGAHLLNATRPPGDLVVALAEDRYLVVLRDLKAPIETVALRVLEGWRRNRPTTTLCIGAALHVLGSPLDTLEQAEGVAASAAVGGGDRILIATTTRTS